MKYRLRTAWLLLWLLLTTMALAGESRRLDIDREEGAAWFTVTVTGDSFRADGEGEWVEGRVREGQWRFTTSRGKRRGVEEKGKIRVTDADGRFVVAVKFEPEKWKILLEEGDPSPWIVKAAASGEAVKVKRGEREVGKVAFYPDQKRVKAKDQGGETRCRIRSDAPELVAALCLVEGIAPVDRLLLSGLVALRQ